MNEVDKVKEGLYFYRASQSPQEVAKDVYGDGHKYIQILKANPEGLVDHDWIVIPNKSGRTTTVDDGETTTQLLQRMFPNQPTHLYVERYLTYNGGFVAEEIVGCKVFVPER